jgi:hypothetical protein
MAGSEDDAAAAPLGERLAPERVGGGAVVSSWSFASPSGFAAPLSAFIAVACSSQERRFLLAVTLIKERERGILSIVRNKNKKEGKKVKAYLR